jgi:hypothetical protein
VSRKKPPRWEHLIAVARRVWDELDEAEYRFNVWDPEVLPMDWPPPPYVPTDRDLAEDQEAAIAAFKEQGDAFLLGHLILSRMKPPLDKSTSLLVWELLHAGAPKPKPGRVGAPKLTEAARRKKNPIHDAADDVDRIIPVLERDYSEQGKRDIKDRAIDIAAKRHGVDRDRLKKHVGRSREDRRRIPPESD